MQLLKNRICGGRPFERLAVGVVVSDELIDALHELLDAGGRAAANGRVASMRHFADSKFSGAIPDKTAVKPFAAFRRSGRSRLQVAQAVQVVRHLTD